MKEKVKMYVEHLLDDIKPCVPYDWLEFEDMQSYLCWTFYTEEYRWQLTATYDKPAIQDNYLGLEASERKPRPEEDLPRRYSLLDGKLDQNTWTSIKDSIIRYGLVEIPKG
ncbi:MAG: hypothetical protein ACXQTL_07555 [Methanosarcinales archaeon]